MSLSEQRIKDEEIHENQGTISMSLPEFTDNFRSHFHRNVRSKKSVYIKEIDGKIINLNKNKKSKRFDGYKVIYGSKKCCVLDLSCISLDSLSSKIGSLINLTELYLYENKLTTLPTQIGLLVNLEKLWLQENSIYMLPDELGNCSKLAHLDLRHNRLDGPIQTVILRLVSLKQLFLTYNRLTDINGIEELKSLQMLLIKCNNLRGSLSDEIEQLGNLTTLDLSKNHLTTLSAGIGRCAALVRLLVDYNELSCLPPEIGRLGKLEMLGIKYNRLTELPDSLSGCQCLQELNTEGNQIDHLPSDLLQSLPKTTVVILSRNAFTTFPLTDSRQYASVKVLSVDYNNLSELDASVFPINNCLNRITLSNNNIQTIPEAVFLSWLGLVELDLSYNRISQLPEAVGSLLLLQILDLTNNELQCLPASIGQLSHLTRLDLGFNKLTALPSEIGQLTELRSLNLDSNQLWRLPHTIGGLIKLCNLKLTDNAIQRLPAQIGELKSLTHLHLGNNKPLDQLPLELALMSSLRFLSFSGCGLRQLPAELVELGPSAVVQHLRALMQIKSKICEQFNIVMDINTDTVTSVLESAAANEPMSTRKYSISSCRSNSYPTIFPIDEDCLSPE